MSTWEYNEVRQAIENKLRTELPADQAHRLAELAMGAFYSFTSGYDLIETTEVGSADETAIKHRYIDARLYYGGGERVRRPRPTRVQPWTPFVPEGETGQFIERGGQG